MSIFVKKDIEWSRYAALSFDSSVFSAGFSQSFGKSFSSGLTRKRRRVRMSGVEREYRDFFKSSIESESSDGMGQLYRQAKVYGSLYHKWLSVRPLFIAEINDGTSGRALATWSGPIISVLINGSVFVSDFT